MLPDAALTRVRRALMLCRECAAASGAEMACLIHADDAHDERDVTLRDMLRALNTLMALLRVVVDAYSLR